MAVSGRRVAVRMGCQCLTNTARLSEFDNSMAGITRCPARPMGAVDEDAWQGVRGLSKCDNSPRDNGFAGPAVTTYTLHAGA